MFFFFDQFFVKEMLKLKWKKEEEDRVVKTIVVGG